MDSKRITVSGPSITQKEIDYVNEAVKNAWYENANYYNNKFEEDFSSYIGTKYAISLPSCTSAIHLALLALGIGPGDEVIVPDITWIATAAPIHYVGATPVFADVDVDSWCISAKSFERSITEKTKAVIPVDLYGGMPDMDSIRRIAQEYNIRIIEDAAEAIGSEYRGRKAGSFGDIGVFSFHGSKTMTTGEGGMLVTDSGEIIEKVAYYRDHGRIIGDKMFWNGGIAYKYKMSSLQAALGIAQLERIEELVGYKRQIFNWYQAFLSRLSGLELNKECPNTRNSFWMVSILWDERYDLTKEQMIERLKSFNIDSRPFFYPLSMLPAYEDITRGVDYSLRNPIAYKISSNAINLPCGMNMDEPLVKTVCSAVESILNDSKRPTL